MLSIRINIKSLIVVAALILLLMSTNAFAFAQHTESEPLPETSGEAINGVPGGPGFLSIPARGFIPADEDNIWYYVNGEIAIGSLTGYNIFQAPLNVPNGATITKLVLYYYDTSHDYDIMLYLFRKPLAGGNEQEMARVQSWYEPGYDYYTDETIANNVIDMQNYVYHLEVRFPSPYNTGNDLRFVGARVDYGYSTYLSLIQK